jgi:hypothetical protein
MGGSAGGTAGRGPGGVGAVGWQPAVGPGIARGGGRGLRVGFSGVRYRTPHLRLGRRMHHHLHFLYALAFVSYAAV